MNYRFLKKTFSLPLLSVIAAILSGGCGHSSSEFNQVVFETIVDESFFSEADVTDESAVNGTLPESTMDSSRSADPDFAPAVAEKIKSGPRFHDRIRINNIGNLREIFNDSNHFQLMHARNLGIEPIHDIRGLYRNRRPLVKVTSCRYYAVDSLTHSFPFLVPEAENLLRNIGANFIDSLASRGADGYKIITTSLLRTPHSVKRLRRVNGNATENSTHQYGTTFDISYTRFECADTTRTINEEDLKNLLAEVLNDLRNRERCMVKFERKTACFHITCIR